MKKQVLSFTILFILQFSSLLVPQTIAENDDFKADQPFRIFWFDTTTDVSYDDPSKLEDPLAPGDTVELEVIVKLYSIFLSCCEYNLLTSEYIVCDLHI